MRLSIRNEERVWSLSLTMSLRFLVTLDFKREISRKGDDVSRFTFNISRVIEVNKILYAHVTCINAKGVYVDKYFSSVKSGHSKRTK